MGFLYFAEGKDEDLARLEFRDDLPAGMESSLAAAQLVPKPVESKEK